MTPDEIINALAEPFEPSEVKFKPSVVSGNRALALAYVDARVIQDRLDHVLGVPNWQDEYEFLDDGSVLCRLRLRIGGEWITKMDVGGESEQKDGGDRRKAAVSDALKRAAVKFGIGRYLYRLPSQWCDYDPHKKQFVRTPSLPGPARKAAPASPPAAKPGPVSQAGPPHPPAGNGQKRPPADGAELEQWINDGESIMAGLGWCLPGELYAHIQHHGMGRKYPAKIVQWAGEALTWAVEEAGRFKAARKLAAEQKAKKPAEKKPPGMTKKTHAAIKLHFLELGLGEDDQAALVEQYSSEDHALTEAQAFELLKDLSQRLAAKKEAERQDAEAEGIV